MALLTTEERTQFLSEHSGWEIEGETLTATFAFADFVEAMGFVTRVALLSEKAFHHPDIDIRWNKVTLRLSTHSEGGLTGKDLALAEKIGQPAKAS